MGTNYEMIKVYGWNTYKEGRPAIDWSKTEAIDKFYPGFEIMWDDFTDREKDIYSNKQSSIRNLDHVSDCFTRRKETDT